LKRIMNHFFQAQVKVRRGADCKMPSHLTGAFITCYAAAATYEDALKLAVKKLSADGFIFEDLVDGKIHELDPSHWDGHVATSWSEFKTYFPPQSDLPRFIQLGGVFFGPVLGWETDKKD